MHVHISLPHALNPCALAKTIITLKHTKMSALKHGLPQPYISTMANQYAPIHSCTVLKPTHYYTHQSYSSCGSKEWSQCSVRKHADKGRATVCVGGTEGLWVGFGRDHMERMYK